MAKRKDLERALKGWQVVELDGVVELRHELGALYKFPTLERAALFALENTLNRNGKLSQRDYLLHHELNVSDPLYRAIEAPSSEMERRAGISRPLNTVERWVSGKATPKDFADIGRSAAWEAYECSDAPARKLYALMVLNLSEEMAL